MTGASEYRPITCLNVMYKAITGTIKELLPSHLLEVDQRRGRVDTKGCIDNLLIDKTVAEYAKIISQEPFNGMDRYTEGI